MTTAQWIFLSVGVLAGLYLIFVFGPAVGSFNSVFNRRKVTPLRRLDLTKGYRAPYREMLLSAADRVEAVPHTEVRMTASDGAVLVADWYNRGGDVTVLFMHGFSTDKMTNFAVQADMCLQHGYNVLMPDHRAHGKSGGKRSGMGAYERYDVLAWIDYAVRTLGASQIVLYGMSMGCTTVSYASEAMDTETVKALILDCGYTSPWEQMRNDMRKWHLPPFLLLPIIGILARLVMGVDIRLPVTDSLANCTVPALFIHGTADRSVTFEQGQRNYLSCGSEKQALFIKNADHTMSLLVGGESARNIVMQFIEKYTKKE